MSTSIMLDTPEQINRFMLAALRGRLKLEMAGMKFRGKSGLAIAKARFPGVKTREEALAKVQEALKIPLTPPAPVAQCAHAT